MMARSSYPIDALIPAVKGALVQRGAETHIRHLLIDSRKAMPAQGTLFIAIKGERHDGHAFIRKVYQKGIRNFMVSNTKQLPELNDANVIVVDDTLQAFQRLAAWHRSLLQIPVLTITGSNGKTVVKEWIYQLLRDEIQITRSPRSYNSQVGVPLSVWLLNKSDDLGIIEAGISLPGEMQALEAIIQPNIGIFTNIGSAHAESFADASQKAYEKARLFKGCHTVIHCIEHTKITEALNLHGYPPENRFTWGRHAAADVKIVQSAPSRKGTLLKMDFRGNAFDLHIPFSDQASIENALHCCAFLLHQNYPTAFVASALQNLTPVEMRLELLDGINNTSIVNDVYSIDLESLEIALDFLLQQKHHSKRTVVLSDILQSGIQHAELYQEVAQLLKRYEVDRLIGVGPHISDHAAAFEMEKAFYVSTSAFLNEQDFNTFHNETILIKGARDFSFEKISRQLQQKAHETVMEVNLEALRHNLNHYRQKLQPGTRIMAMVKAFSYGTGAHEIASVLEHNRVDYLAVAYADEGIALRKAGISLPIMVMNPEISGYEAMLKYRLEPELYSFRVLQSFTGLIERQGVSVPYPVHLKIDTGMHRLGFEPDDMEQLIAHLKAHPLLKVTSVFSHFVSSDNPEHDDFSRRQLHAFNTIATQFKEEFGTSIIAHMANSAAIDRFPEAHLDMVRLGIGLYGISSHENTALEPVNTLKTVVSQIKHIPKGETIGYGRRGIATEDMRLATLPIGYADGLDRRLSNGVGKVYIHQQKAPIIGSVCMDMCMVDITGLQVNEGDVAVIFGPEQSINTIAKSIGTIPYEILTSVSRRVKRVYFTE